MLGNRRKMAEINRQKINSIYSEIYGYLNGISDRDLTIPKEVAQNYNQLLIDLTDLTQTNFGRHTIKKRGSHYLVTDVRMSMSSVASRLKSDYNFSDQNTPYSSPVVVNVNQNQQMTISVTTIKELIESHSMMK